MCPRSGFRSGGEHANVPSFGFRSGGNIRQNHPRSGFRSGGTSAKTTLVPVFVPGEHPPKPPFWKTTLLGSSERRAPHWAPRACQWDEAFLHLKGAECSACSHRAYRSPYRLAYRLTGQKLADAVPADLRWAKTRVL